MSTFHCLALLILAPLLPAQELGPVVARTASATVLEDQLEPVLVERFAMNEDGRELCKVLLSDKLIRKIAGERGLKIKEAQVDRKFDELDREIRAAGGAGGILGELERQGMSVPEFRAYLRTSMLQEELTRRDKDVNALLPVSGPMQESWLAAQFMEHGVEFPTPPWADGVVARSRTGLAVGIDEYRDTLRRRLPPDDVRETAWHLILLAGIQARLVDLAPEKREQAIDAELARRRARHAAEFPQLTFEQRLAASGRTLEGLRADPSVQIAALARLWVDRKYGDAGLRQAYEADREFYEGRFGAAARCHLLFLVAGKFTNDHVKRTFEDAEVQLERFLDEIGNTDDFQALARQHSEEPKTRTTGGALGFVTRNDPRVPPEVRRIVFQFLDSGGQIPAEGVALGPERFDSGSALLWVDSVRPSPEWDVMVEHVHNVLRARFLDGIAKREDVVLADPSK